MRIPESLESTAAEQLGLLAMSQLRGAGVTRSSVRWALGRTWRLVLPRVVATFTGELDDDRRLVAAALWGGPAAQLAASTALRWHGRTEVPDDGLVRLLVPWGEPQRREAFAVRRRTRRPDPRPWRRGALTICSRPRAAVDAARELTDPRDVHALLIGVVQDRWCRESDLRAELEAGPARGSASLRRALNEVCAGAWSVAEAEVLHELSRSIVLPHVWPNPTLVAADGTTLPTPDFWLDDVGVAGQVHSRAHHERSADWESTVQADTTFAEHGITVVAVTPTGFRKDPCAFRERVERAYLAARRAGRRPAVTMTPRGSGVR